MVHIFVRTRNGSRGALNCRLDTLPKVESNAPNILMNGDAKQRLSVGHHDESAPICRITNGFFFIQHESQGE